MSELQVLARPNMFRATPAFIGGVPCGLTLAEIVKEVHRRGDVPVVMQAGAIVQLNGEIIPSEYWRRIRPKEAANIVVTVSLHMGGNGGGKKNPIAMILSLAVIVAAPYLGGLAAGFIGLQAGSTAFLLTQSLVGGLIVGVGSMAINALFPTRPASLPSRPTYSDSPTYSIEGAQNNARVFAPVPVVLGRHRVTPPLGALPYTEVSGNDEYLRMLFIWGYGPLKIEDIRIGETPIGDYDDIEIETREGRFDDEPITLIPSQVLQDSIGVSLTSAAGWIQRTSKTNADELSVDIGFPRGLVQFLSDGTRASRTVVVEVEYRAVGASSWTPVYTFNITDAFVGALRKGYRWKVTTGQYEIRLRRATADSASDSITDAVLWATLRTFRSEPPVNFPHPLAMTAVRIRASEQLQGIIDDLNGIVTSYATVWNGTAWTGEAATQNPAALMRLVLTGPANARPRAASQVDDESLGAFFDFCAANGYKFNMARDFAASVWDACADICSAARAAPSIVDAKWGVIMDTPDKPVVQHFTPRNSWGFSGEIDYADMPHAWRVRFVDEDNGYKQDERVVYDDGYSEVNATKFEGIEFPGITNRDLVWKFGRYHIAQARLRPQTYRINADFEHLVCRRGDLIRVSHDVPLWGSGSGRVKALTTNGANTTGVAIDETIVMEASKAYVCRFRLEDGTSLLAPVITEVGETDTLTFQTPLATTSGPQVGDLAMFGIANQETGEFLVKSIRPGQDITAVIEFVDYAPNLYLADQGDIPDFNPNITQPADLTKIQPAVPVITNIESGTIALEKTPTGIKSRILVSLQTGANSIRVSEYAVRYKLSGSTDWRYTTQPSEQPAVILTDVVDGQTYDIQARAVSIYGVSSGWTASSYETVAGQTEPPANVAGFRLNVINGIAYLAWNPNTEVDLSHYEIRWTQLKTGALWSGSVVVVQRIAATSVTLQALDGTYLIKAVDSSGNYSASASTVSTSLVALQGFNFVASLSQETPSWSGSGSGVVYDSNLGGLVLEDGFLEGVYEFPDVLDLNGVFKVLATAEIASSSVNLSTNLYDIANLYDFGNLYGVVEGQTDVAIEIAATDEDPSP